MEHNFWEVKSFVYRVLDSIGLVYGNALCGRSVESLEFVREYAKMVCPVRNRIHNKVRHPLMRECEESYRGQRYQYDANRYNLKRVISHFKDYFGDCLDVKNENLARSLVMIGMLGFVMFVEVRIKNFCLFVFGVFTTLARRYLSNSQLSISIIPSF